VVGLLGGAAIAMAGVIAAAMLAAMLVLVLVERSTRSGRLLPTPATS
jgi:hypothetical protein